MRACSACRNLPARTSPMSFSRVGWLLQEKLGERLDLPASAITEAAVDEKLRPRGLPDSTLDELRELFQATNLARYAPIKPVRNWRRSFRN